MARKDLTFSPGDDIMFMPGTERKPPHRKGTFVQDHGEDRNGKMVLVHLDTDPFEVVVYEANIRKATSEETKESTKMPKAKELRRQAKALGVANWEDMGLAELEEAVAEAEKSNSGDDTSSKKDKKKGKKDKSNKGKSSTTSEDGDGSASDNDTKEEKTVAKKTATKSAPAKKATASKTAAKKSAPAKKAASAPREREVQANGNPYPKGSNLGFITDLLIKGGKLEKIVDKVCDKLTINERSASRTEEETRKEWHRRIVIVTQKLRNDFGFTMDKDGRGLESTIRLTPPK